jgi:hypothetical protein
VAQNFVGFVTAPRQLRGSWPKRQCSSWWPRQGFIDVVHIVCGRLKESANGKSAQDNALEMRRRFAALPGVIAGMPRCDVGIDISRTDQSAVRRIMFRSRRHLT